MLKKYKNYLNLHEQRDGINKQIEIASEPFDKTSFLPKTLVYEDIDREFKNFVEERLQIVSDNGKEFPTMTLYSNQRFSEYTQSWKYTDEHGNILLNFKTVNRENNPQYGKIQQGYWNIPQDDRFYTMKKIKVMDDNGTESLLLLKVKQPTSIDLSYKISIFTTQYQSINEFNTLINRLFNSRQAYIKPNGYYIPITLESINDESSYSIDDRQFYGQTYNVKAMAFVITEDDLRVDEVPLKRGFSLPLNMTNNNKSKPDVEIDEEDQNGVVTLTITMPQKCNNYPCKFTMDCDMVFDKIVLDNILNNYKMFVDGEEIQKTTPFTIKNGNSVKIIYNKQIDGEDAKITLIGKNI